MTAYQDYIEHIAKIGEAASVAGAQIRDAKADAVTRRRHREAELESRIAEIDAKLSTAHADYAAIAAKLQGRLRSAPELHLPAQVDANPDVALGIDDAIGRQQATIAEVREALRRYLDGPIVTGDSTAGGGSPTGPNPPGATGGSKTAQPASGQSSSDASAAASYTPSYGAKPSSGNPAAPGCGPTPYTPSYGAGTTNDGKAETKKADGKKTSGKKSERT